MWREVIEDPTFTPRFRQIVPNPQLLDELLTGVMWVSPAPLNSRAAASARPDGG